MKLVRTSLVLFLLGFQCLKPTAATALDSARQAIEEARRKKAGDCAASRAPYEAAEAAFAEAQRFENAGDIELAKSRAAEAQRLAEQASAASSPDCA